jgi:hypothetical protein
MFSGEVPLSAIMDNEEYRAKLTATRDVRDDELDDLDKLKDVGRINTPEKKEQTRRVLAEYKARTELLKELRFGAVADAPRPAPPAPAAPTAPVLVYLRVKEGQRELISRCGVELLLGMDYAQLLESTLLQSSPGDWERLKEFPIIIDTFPDCAETERGKVVMKVYASVGRAPNVRRVVFHHG